MALPVCGTFSYGTVAFDALVFSNVRVTYNWDEAGRTIVSATHRIHLRGYVTAGDAETCDEQMSDWYTVLSTPCQVLHYDNGRGFGGPHGQGLTVVRPGGPVDVDFGPKPRVITFVPLGGGAAQGVGIQAARVEWEVETTIPTCSDAAYQKQLMALNYETLWHIDGDTGLTQLTYSGYLQIPLTRQVQGNGRTLVDNADAYRDRFNPPVPQGFHRVTQDYKLNKAKNRLDFNIVDQELDYPPPEGCTRAEGDHTFEWNRSPNATWFVNTISATLTTAPGYKTVTALEKFRIIVDARIEKAKAGIKWLAGVEKKNGKKGTPANIFLDGLRISEGLFNRTSRFSARYRIIGTTIKNVLVVTGLYQDIGLSWDKWTNSMADTAHNQRGGAKLKFSNTQDLIIDLCAPAKNGQAVLRAQPARMELKILDQIPDALPVGAPNVAGFHGVRPDNSWIAYNVSVRLVEDDRTVRHKPLNSAATARENEYSPQALVKAAIAQAETGGTEAGVTGKVPDIIQRVTQPTYTVRVTGRALRLAHEIPEPRLLTVGGVKVTQARQVIDHGTASVVAGFPIYWKTFDITYKVPATPSSVPLLANPALQTDGRA